MRHTPSGRSGEAVSLERGFDGARAENPKFDNSRPVRRREAPTNMRISLMNSVRPHRLTKLDCLR